MQHSVVLDGFFACRRHAFSDSFPFVPPAAHFSQQLEKWAKEPFETNGFKTSFPLKSFVYYRS